MLGKLDCHGYSTAAIAGLVNHDQFLIADLNKSLQVHLTTLNIENQSRMFGQSQGKLFVVADGEGLTTAAERASQLAVDTVSAYLLNTMPWLLRLDSNREDDFLDDLTAAISACQETIQREADVIDANRGMGTTLTMAYLVWPRLYVVHVGDSRCYLFRRGRLQQLTRDHTQATKLVNEGLLKPQEAESHPWSNVLSNVVGGESDRVQPEAHRADLQTGDVILLCTDGLHKHITGDEITRVLSGDRPAEEMVRDLVHQARANGSPDSVTAVIGRLGVADNQTAQAETVETAVPVANPQTPQDPPADPVPQPATPA